jgi:inorganic triphosphatase YgiF
MADEVELKLALAAGHQARFLRHPLLRQAVMRHVDNLDNIYYDTGDLALHRRGIALRLRRKGSDWLQTVKLAGTAAAGLSSRPEWEVPYRGHFDFSGIDDAPVREWLQRPKLLARIVPICETRFRRSTWKFSAAPGAVLLTLDRGWIIANGRREAISELELELVEAPLQAVFTLARELARRVALTPSVISKAERGYRLHLGTPQQPVKAVTVALSAAMPPFEAFRRIALSCLEHLQHNHHGALSSDDPEYIHQMRVATRRLRAAMRLFDPALPARQTDLLHEPLRDLIRQLGRARDLDVLLTEIANPVLAALPDEPRLQALASDITNRRYAAREQAVAMLAAPEYGSTLLTALESLHASPPAAATAIPLIGFAAARLRRLRKRLRRLAASTHTDDPASLHALRIATKRLRYALEFFAPLITAGTWHDALSRLATVQDILGQLNDLANAGTLLMDCAGNDPRLREAVSLIGGWHGPRYAGLLANLTQELDWLARLRLPKLEAAAMLR